MADLFWLAALTLALWLGLGSWWAAGVARMHRLSRARPPEPASWPRVAVVVPARNEADGVEAAMRTLLDLDYPDLEIVAVDDRSEDGTGAILDRLARTHPRLRVLHIRELPAGWLGKTHALQRGAEATAAPWLLFTDADVHLRPDAVRETVAFALAHGREHLAALPRFVAAGPLVGSFMSSFALLFSMFTRMWAAPDPDSDAAIGIGAFGLIRADAYVRAGRHERVRMRPDDDLALGQALKDAGASQEAVFAGDYVSVAWYPDVLAAVRGMRKNAFAGVGFSVPLALGVVLVLLITHVLPYLAIFLTTGATRALFAAVVLVIVAVYVWNRRFTDVSPLYALLHPIGVLFLCVATLGSTLHALRGRGVEWRGTRYSLEELRRGRDEDSSP